MTPRHQCDVFRAAFRNLAMFFYQRSEIVSCPYFPNLFLGGWCWLVVHPLGLAWQNLPVLDLPFGPHKLFWWVNFLLLLRMLWRYISLLPAHIYLIGIVPVSKYIASLATLAWAETNPASRDSSTRLNIFVSYFTMLWWEGGLVRANKAVLPPQMLLELHTTLLSHCTVHTIVHCVAHYIKQCSADRGSVHT